MEEDRRAEEARTGEPAKTDGEPLPEWRPKSFYDKYEAWILMGLSIVLAVILWFFFGEKLSEWIGGFLGN